MLSERKPNVFEKLGFVGVRCAHRQPTGYGSWVVFVMSGLAWYWDAGDDRREVTVDF